MLTDDMVELVQRLQGNEFPAGADPYEEHVPFFTSIPMLHPLSSAPEPKRRFVPSKWEHEKIMKIVRAIRAVSIINANNIVSQSIFLSCQSH